ncbi:MAG: TFIIB-type zinc ribbon-containing protein, partial [Promethearchaeia archaeon]
MTQTHRPCYKTNEDLICPECNLVTGVTDKKTGDIICERCGLILSERNVDPSHTRRMPTREGKEDRCRTGPLHLPTTLYFSSTIRKKDILHLSITNEQR